MIFNEIYGCYYQAVAKALGLAVRGKLNQTSLKKVIDETAFSESFLEIIPALKDRRWKLLLPDMTTPLKKEPVLPLTELEKRWLKTILLDRRMALFRDDLRACDLSFLDETEPLFAPEDWVIYDKYADGDDFEAKEYVDVFRTVLEAIRNRRKISVLYRSAKGKSRRLTGDPVELEFSEKDDRFRVRLGSCRIADSLLMSGIEECRIVGEWSCEEPKLAFRAEKNFTVELKNERNALERFMLAFANFKKEASNPGEGRYEIKVYYDGSDETELVIRVLAFGPFVKVRSPEDFQSLIIERLKKQKSCGLR